MGLSKSKHKLRRGEEQRVRSSHSAQKSKDQVSDVTSQDSRQLGREPEKPADGALPRARAGQHPRPSSSEERPDVKQKLNKKNIIPQIIITRPSNETLVSYGSEDQRTIQEQVGWGPYWRHRNPSTIVAYRTSE